MPMVMSQAGRSATRYLPHFSNSEASRSVSFGFLVRPSKQTFLALVRRNAVSESMGAAGRYQAKQTRRIRGNTRLNILLDSVHAEYESHVTDLRKFAAFWRFLIGDELPGTQAGARRSLVFLTPTLLIWRL